MTTLSNRGYPMLREFIERGPEHVMKIVEAQQYDQRPFRSMLMRGWVEYSPKGRGFRITKQGREAWREFNATGISRKDPSLPLTAYFDADTYGISFQKAKKANKHAERAAA